MAFDSASRKTILFGGASINGEPLNDIWEWIDQVWTQVVDIGPSPRGFHTMRYDSHRHEIILFGGFDGSIYTADTWEWDGTEWKQVADIGPSNRASPSMVYDSSKKEMLLFGVSIKQTILETRGQ